MAHNEAIIQWFLAAIVSFATYLFVRSIFGKKTEAVVGASNTSMDQIQAMIKRILDQTSMAEKLMMTATPVAAGVPTSGPMSGLSGAPVAAPGPDPAEMIQLKKVLQEREEELNKLKNSTGDDKLKSQISRIQELESKLREYEILEDDIADLSIYKEENVRLRLELQKISTAPSASKEALVDQFAQVVDQAKDVGPGPEVAQIESTGDAMADFATAVESERAVIAASEAAKAAAGETAALEAPAELPAEPPEEPPVPAPAAIAEPIPIKKAEPLTAVQPPDSPEATNNLFAEFSAGALDTDRVMEELDSLEKLKDADGSNALEESLDPDKLVAQASGFHKP